MGTFKYTFSRYWLLACPFLLAFTLAGKPIKSNTGKATHIVTLAKFMHPEASKMWLLKMAQHPFSDPKLKDTFKLYLIGSSIIDGKVKFQIVSHTHKVIFSEVFPATDLYGDMDEENSGVTEKLSAIKTRFGHFFDNDAFSNPAISRNLPIDPDYFDVEAVKAIKADTGTIGFTYAHSYEGVYEIVWLKSQKKVVTCFSSD